MRPAPFAKLVVCLLLMTSCRQQQQVGHRGAPATSGAVLEQAALKAGSIHSGSTVDPVGLFGGDHGDGTDSLCLSRRGDAYRFDLRLAYGDQQTCKGSGGARRAGETLILDFDAKRDGTHCTLVADYDGDRIAFPGAVDKACDGLCTGRSSIAGVGFTRTDGSCEG